MLIKFLKEQTFIAKGLQYWNNLIKINKLVYKSKLDLKEVQEILFLDYSEKLLQELKKEEENTYENLRKKERELSAHTPEHIIIIEQLNKTQQNLTIIKEELKHSSNKKTNHLLKIKKTLKLN